MDLARLTIEDVLALRDRRSMHFPGGDLYVAVVAYVLGIDRAVPGLLSGFQEYVSVTRSGDVVQGWPRAVLHGALDAAAAESVLGGSNDVELNARAISTFFDAVDEYQSVRMSDGLEAIRAKYREMHGD